MDLENLKAPVWGLTAAGAALGLMGGPLGVVVGAAAGGALDYLRHTHRLNWKSWHPLEEIHLRAVRLVAPRVPDAVIQHKATVAGNDPPQEALELQGFIDSQGRKDEEFWASPELAKLVGAFQEVYNTDIPVSGDVGRIAVTGKLDPKTAAALTLYTHKAVSADPALT
jgi:hypothetical protein